MLKKILTLVFIIFILTGCEPSDNSTVQKMSVQETPTDIDEPFNYQRSLHDFVENYIVNGNKFAEYHSAIEISDELEDGVYAYGNTETSMLTGEEAVLLILRMNSNSEMNGTITMKELSKNDDYGEYLLGSRQNFNEFVDDDGTTHSGTVYWCISYSYFGNRYEIAYFEIQSWTIEWVEENHRTNTVSYTVWLEPRLILPGDDWTRYKYWLNDISS